jgi:hypothetical protein
MAGYGDMSHSGVLFAHKMGVLVTLSLDRRWLSEVIVLCCVWEP